jgi:hypothetical protein
MVRKQTHKTRRKAVKHRRATASHKRKVVAHRRTVKKKAVHHARDHHVGSKYHYSVVNAPKHTW